MKTLKIENAKILKSIKMNKSTAENNKTSAPKNQMIVKDEKGELHVVIWFQYIGIDEFDNRYNFTVKETNQGWMVKDAKRLDQ